MYFAHAFMLTTAMDKWFPHLHLPCMVANEIGTKLAIPLMISTTWLQEQPNGSVDDMFAPNAVDCTYVRKGRA